MKTLLTKTSPNATPVYHIELTQKEMDVICIGLLQCVCRGNTAKFALISMMLRAVPYETVIKSLGDAQMQPENELCIKFVSSAINLAKSQSESNDKQDE
jgi:hypothetical protein